MPERYGEWPERLVFRGRGWTFFTSCVLIVLSPILGIALDFGLIIVGLTDDITGFFVYLPLLSPVLCGIGAAFSPRFEMTVVPKAIPGVIGEPFEATIEVQLPGTPKSFEVALLRGTNRRRSSGAWYRNVKIPMAAVRSLGDGRHRLEVAINVPPMEKATHFTWSLFVQARTAGFSGDYRVYFPVAMNEATWDV